MKRFSKQATAIALLAVSIFAVPSGNTAIASRTNCNSVNKTYPFGIALNKQSIGTSRAEIDRKKYTQLKFLDKDLDGIVCEIEKLQTKVTIPATTKTTITQQVCVGDGWCSLGDIGPGGGIVFYDAGSVQPWGRYLEAAPKDIESSNSWCDISSLLKVSAIGIGQGMSNTTTADQACSSGAIQQAADFINNNKSDWFLPSRDELNQLYLNRKIVGGFNDGDYWSSSEVSNSNVWTQDFAVGYQYSNTRKELCSVSKPCNSYPIAVRPIRAF